MSMIYPDQIRPGQVVSLEQFTGGFENHSLQVQTVTQHEAGGAFFVTGKIVDVDAAGISEHEDVFTIIIQPAVELKLVLPAVGDEVHVPVAAGERHRGGRFVEFGVHPVAGTVVGLENDRAVVRWSCLCRFDGSPFGKMPGQVFQSVEPAGMLEVSN